MRNVDQIRIAVFTANRSSALNDCLRLILTNETRTGGRPTISVFDDSRSESTRCKNRTVIAGYGKSDWTSPDYVGPETLHALATRLNPQAPLRHACTDDQTVGFLTSLGSVRNAALLLNAGHKVVFVDDDIRFQFSRLKTGCCFNSSREERPVQEMETDIPTTPVFIQAREFTTHLIFGCFETTNAINSITESFHTRVIDEIDYNLDGRSRIATTGITGNRWFDRPSAFLTVRGPLRHQVYFPSGTYSDRKTGPHAIIQAAQYIKTEAPFLVSALCGYDNRQMLPPFPPAGRSSDTAFASLLHFIEPDALFTHLPVCAHHDLVPPRPVREEDFVDATIAFGTLTLLILRFLMNRLDLPDSSTPGERLRLLGTELHNLATCPADHWHELLHELCIAHVTQEITLLESLLDIYNGQPHWWAKDVEHHIDALVDHVADPRSAVPRELRRNYRDNPIAAIELHRKFCQDYGSLMIKWPEIWAAAAAANASQY